MLTDSRWQENVAYSDGAGNVVQTKARIEAGRAPRIEAGEVVWDEGVDPRWLGSGRTILNNKGNPVKQFEPFFARDDAFETDTLLTDWGVTPLLHYDAIGCCHRPRSAANHAPIFADTDARAQYRQDAPIFTERSRILPEAQSELGWQIISTMSIPTRGVDMVEISNRTEL
jgi:hypothetical protein